MATTIYCKTTAKGQQSYYLTNNGKEIILFRADYRKSNKEYFGNGRTMGDVFKAKKHHSASTRKIAERIISAIKYIEKEYEMSIFEQTAKSKSVRLRNKKEQARMACRGKIDLNDYIFETIA